MPPGLFNPLNPDELRDLMAYLVSRGNPDVDIYADEDEEESPAEDESD